MKLYIKQLKPVLGSFEKNLGMMEASIDEAIELGKELIVFPELALNGNTLEDIAYDIAIKEVPTLLLEKSKKIDIIFGASELGEDDFVYNTAFYLSDGKVLGKHRKIYLANYGGSAESRIFAEGNSINVIDTKFGKIGMILGEEFYHQSVEHLLAQAGAKYIFVLASEIAHLDVERVGEEIELVARTNSLLNGIYTIVANRVGVEDGRTFIGRSLVVAPNGKIIQEVAAFEENDLSCDLDNSEIRRTRAKKPLLKNEKTQITIKELKKIIKEKRG